jgi:gamma-glutamyl-gamma-aminobutyrate hydrolase PuuD
VNNYLDDLQRDPELRTLILPDPKLARGSAIALDSIPTGTRTQAAMIANWYSDMGAKGGRSRRNLSTFQRVGADPFIIALAADHRLTPGDQAEFAQKIWQRFDLLISLGGNDIDSALYDQETTFARNTNRTRDLSELRLVKAFKFWANQNRRGVFFGICRGHQMGAIADGHQLYQDITGTGAGDTARHGNIEATDGSMQTWHHIEIKDSLLARFIRKWVLDPKKVRVNSVHHQAVDLRPDADSFAVAIDADSEVNEGLQMKNGLGLSLQFHPEFTAEVSGDATFSQMGESILKGITAYARMVRERADRAHRGSAKLEIRCDQVLMP